MQRLRNLDVPESRIKEIRETRSNPRTLDWPSPVERHGTWPRRSSTASASRPGDELYRIADMSTVWIIADIAESDLALHRASAHARKRLMLRAYPN